ncbi:hypothetical protein CC1G_06537 [Coprinopsis cinerea okayama7|uniref:ZZ-type domain-containing protein n=1 Tax=Coprinopsis cinerea (strain Okayama-7 / 130 / ATCC MYA-4618 / FGSC 9003) TaxID=240176 RepID=A8N2V5_COPC7|nr:hypothetical protein CC1G_06537 [Coprinopsis cinerea okayama7\|eukprot:XP_001829200.1 hypothetical protein CC1G_06537 [Coprinopsis cinerea okayama7\
MFTVKATYRGETRKITFAENTFPSYAELCKQLYRVFPLNDNYHLSKLLFSPDAAAPGRILIAVEVHNAADYERSLLQFKRCVYTNGLLRFSVFDDTPHKQPSRTSFRSGPLNSIMDTSMNSSTALDDDKRPAVPPKPAGMFESMPFQYIASLSSASRSTRTSSRDMDIDSNATGVLNSQASVESMESIRSVIEGLKKDLNKSLASLDTITATVSSGPTRSNTVTSANASGLCSAEDLAPLFQEGCFPSMGPSSRRSSHLSLRRASRHNHNHHGQNTSTTQQQQPSPVVHTNVWCDACLKNVVGIRHKCLDCPDYDLCTPCIKSGGAENHNPFHEFFEINEPGRVIVHTVFDGGRGNRRSASRSARDAPAEQQPASVPAPVAHSARCDLCESMIFGDRYKCCNCPDYDTCMSCFAITPEQHPGHSFVKLSADDMYIRRGPHSRKPHYATCNACTQRIHGVRYKCMHPECPDYDLCDRCEALPIPVHPDNHPMLKMKTVDTVVPTVYRVGATQFIPVPSQDSSAPQQPVQHEEMRSVTPKPVISPGEVVAEERATTPRPVPIVQDSREVDAHSPFADPPVIAPIGEISSLASSFEATVTANRIGIHTPSPAEVESPVASTASPFVDRFLDTGHRDSGTSNPSFVEDLVSQIASKLLSPPTGSPVPVTGALSALTLEDGTSAAPEPEMPLADMVSQAPTLLALVKDEDDVKVVPINSPEPSQAAVAPLSAAFIADVTVTDGQVFPPGAEFVKCWRLLNDSTRDWPENTELIFVAGESLVIDRKSEVVKIGSVKAGEEVEVWTGELKAPDVPGRYVGYWRLRDDTGSVFGNSIWVEISVAEVDHSSDDSNSLSASSIIMMPRVGSESNTSRAPLSVRQPESTIGDSTATIPSSTEDGNSDIDNDSDVSLIDLISSDDEDNMGWEDARSHATADTRASNAPAAAQTAETQNEDARRSPNPDYVLLFDDSSDSDF